jgi:poly(3-hydroxybutyrate) depolymerase
MIAFHGTAGVGDDPTHEWIDEGDWSDPSGLEGLANENRFVIAAPESRLWSEDECVDWDNHDGWSGYYWETRCNGAEARGSNPEANEDLILVRAIIAQAIETYNVNPRRIYLIGFSNGGFFSIHTAMILRDEIAAFAAIGSGLNTCDHTRSCRYPGDVGTETTDCDTILGSAPDECTSCPGPEKPVTIPDSGRLIPGFIAHNNNDDIVAAYYSCGLGHGSGRKKT